MQAVILAAGKSTRTYPLTVTMPKPLLKVANKEIICHNLDNLNELIDEAIIIVGYRKQMLIKALGKRYKKIELRYIKQKEQLGTAHAASLAEPYIKDRFMMMAGDDIYSKSDIQKSIKHRYSILVSPSKNWKSFGVITQRKGLLVDFVEKPEKFISDLVNTSFYVLDRKIFELLPMIKKSKRGEYEFPDAIKLLTKEEKIHCVKANRWIPIGYPWDLLKADAILRGKKNFIGHGSRIFSKVTNSSIGEDCIIKGNVSNSIVMDRSRIEQGSVVEDSIIGGNVYFKGMAKSKKNAKSMVKNVDVKVRRLGTIIADNVWAENVKINPGCKIWPDKKIKDMNIKKDVE